MLLLPVGLDGNRCSYANRLINEDGGAMAVWNTESAVLRTARYRTRPRRQRIRPRIRAAALDQGERPATVTTVYRVRHMPQSRLLHTIRGQMTWDPVLPQSMIVRLGGPAAPRPAGR